MSVKENMIFENQANFEKKVRILFCHPPNQLPWILITKKRSIEDSLYLCLKYCIFKTKNSLDFGHSSFGTFW